MPDLSVDYLGKKLKNPLIVASSGLTRTHKLMKRVEKPGRVPW